MNWRKIDNSLTESIISRLEKQVNINFPESFIQFILKNNHGRPEKPVFDTGKSNGRMIGALLNFNIEKKHADNFLEVYENIKHSIPKGFFPFASDPSGNYLCAEIKDNKLVNINLWNHEKEFETPKEEGSNIKIKDYHSLEFVADSLDDFFDKLYITQ